MQKIFDKSFFEIKKFVAELPEKKYFHRLFWLSIGASFLSGLLGFFSYTGLNIVKNTFLNANLVWPPEYNHSNMIMLRDTIEMIIIYFLSYYVILFIFSFLASKIAKLFKREITIYKVWNILAYAGLINALIGLVAAIIFVLLDYASPYNLTAPFLNIILSIFGIVMACYIIIYGFKISLKRIERIRK